MVHYIADRFGRGLRAIQEPYPDWFVGHPAERPGDGPRVRPPAGRQVRDARSSTRTGCGRSSPPSTRGCSSSSPGILLNPELCEELLDRTEVAIGGRARGRAPAGRDHGSARDERAAARRSRGRAARPGDARAGAVGRAALREYDRAHVAAHRRGRRRGRHRHAGGTPSGRCARPGSASSSTRSSRTTPARAGIVEHYAGPRLRDARGSTPSARSSRSRARPAWCSR